MDRQLFIEKLSTINDEEYIDVKEQVKEIVDADYLLNKNTEIKGLYNLIIGMEELSELQKEISKLIRNKGDGISILEEMADVTIILEELKYINGISDEQLEDAIQVKLHRAKSNMENNLFL